MRLELEAIRSLVRGPSHLRPILGGLKELTPASGTFGQQIVVGGQKVIVRGAVVDGVTKLGTAFTQ